MNSHAYLAKKLLKLAEISNENAVRLQALLRCIEELACYKYNIDDSTDTYQIDMLNLIKKDEDLYELYNEVLDEMFYYLLGEYDIDLKETIERVNREVNRQIKEI